MSVLELHAWKWIFPIVERDKKNCQFGVAFIRPQPGTHGPLALAERVKVRHFSCSTSQEEARVT